MNVKPFKMRKVGGCFLFIVVIVLIPYSLWISYPPVVHPERLQAIENEVSERYREFQTRFLDSTKNGFLSEEFRPFWGRKGEDWDPASPIAPIIDNWVKYSSVNAGVQINHPELVLDPDYLQARHEFEALLPSLTEAVQKPLFFAPEDKLTPDNVLPNLQAVRASYEALLGLAESWVQQDRVADAADLVVDTIEWGESMQNGVNLIYETVGVQIQSKGANAFFSLVTPHSKLREGQWKELAQRFTETISDPDQIQTVMDSEMLMLRALVEDSPETKESVLNELGDVFPTFLKLPGVYSREVRLFNNSIVELHDELGRYRTQGVPDTFENFTYLDWLTGRTGFFAFIALPNYPKLSGEFNFNRSKLVALSLVSGTLAFQEKTGELPSSLDAIRQAGFAICSRELTDELDVSYTIEDGVVTLAVPYSSGAFGSSLERDFIYGSSEWVSLDQDAIRCRFSPPAVTD